LLMLAGRERPDVGEAGDMSAPSSSQGSKPMFSPRAFCRTLSEQGASP